MPEGGMESLACPGFLPKLLGQPLGGAKHLGVCGFAVFLCKEICVLFHCARSFAGGPKELQHSKH